MPLTLLRPISAGVLMACAGWAAAQDNANGLKYPLADTVWPGIQTRLTIHSTSPLNSAQGGAASFQGTGTRRLESLSLLGDYYFRGPRLFAGSEGGFRATSGLIFGQATNRALSMFGQDPQALSQRWSGPGAPASESPLLSALPYLGFGYTSVSLRAGWGFSADIGMVAGQAGAAIKLGRVMGGGQSLDEVLREMRLTPLLNLGVSYSF